MEFTEVGMVIEVREVQEAKAWFPTTLTEEGMTTEVRDEHPLNAASAMEDTALGMVMIV